MMGMRFSMLTIQQWRELRMKPILTMKEMMDTLKGIHIHLLQHKWAIITSKWTIQRLDHILSQKRMLMEHMKLMK